MDETRRGSSEEEPLWKTPMSDTRHEPSEESPFWETLVSRTRSGPSEEEPLWEALGEETPPSFLRGGVERGNLGGARPSAKAPESRCQGKRSDEQGTREDAQ